MDTQKTIHLLFCNFPGWGNKWSIAIILLANIHYYLCSLHSPRLPERYMLLMRPYANPSVPYKLPTCIGLAVDIDVIAAPPVYVPSPVVAPETIILGNPEPELG
jgi:hypothetical protein